MMKPRVSRTVSTRKIPRPQSREREESTARFSPQAIPECDGLGENVIAFAHRPVEPEAHHLPENCIKGNRDLRSKKMSILSGKLPSRLEVVGHVQCAASAAPIGRADCVIANRI